METHHYLQDDSDFTIPRYVAEFEHIRSELNLSLLGSCRSVLRCGIGD